MSTVFGDPNPFSRIPRRTRPKALTAGRRRLWQIYEFAKYSNELPDFKPATLRGAEAPDLADEQVAEYAEFLGIDLQQEPELVRAVLLLCCVYCGCCSRSRSCCRAPRPPPARRQPRASAVRCAPG